MPNYIDDDTALPAARVDRRPVPPGESETKFVDATFCNALLQFNEDARNAIQAIQAAPVTVDGTTITGAGTALDPLVAASSGGSGTVGPGTIGKLAKFTAGDTVDDSIISESGTTATVTGSLTLSGDLTAGDSTSLDSHTINGLTTVNATGTAQIRLADGVGNYWSVGRDNASTGDFHLRTSAGAKVAVSASAANSALVINSSSKATFSADVGIGGALDHDGTTVGFYSTAPITKQTGVAVTAEAIHAALVALGLIGA